MIESASEFLKYNEFLKNLVSKDLKVRYKRSILGYLWTMLNPLLTMIVLSVVFSTLLRFDMKDFSVFLICGLLPWNFFAQSVSISTMSIIGGAGLIKKVYVPKAIFPISNVMSNLVNFMLALVPLFIIKLALGSPISPAVLFLPVPIIILFFFVTGVSMIFATLNVFFRDIAHITDVLFQAWFYLTPVIYPMKMIPDNYKIFFRINPMFYFIKCFKMPLYEGVLPSAEVLMVSFIAAIISFSFGWWLLHKYENVFFHYL